LLREVPVKPAVLKAKVAQRVPMLEPRPSAARCLQPNVRPSLQRHYARLGLVVSQIKEMRRLVQKRLEQEAENDHTPW